MTSSAPANLQQHEIEIMFVCPLFVLPKLASSYQMENVQYFTFYCLKKWIIFIKNCLTKNIWTIHSSNWNNPRPGHSPRLDPKKFRDSMKLNFGKVHNALFVVHCSCDIRYKSFTLITELIANFWGRFQLIFKNKLMGKSIKIWTPPP